MKKIFVVIFALVLVFALASCAADDSDITETPDFSVEAVASADDAGSSAADLMLATMQEEELAFTNENGLFDNIGGYAYDAEKNEGWQLFLNHEYSMVGANDITLEEGDIVEFRWGCFNDVF